MSNLNLKCTIIYNYYKMNIINTNNDNDDDNDDDEPPIWIEVHGY